MSMDVDMTNMDEYNARIFKEYKKKSHLSEIWHQLKKNKLAMFGLVIVVILALTAIFANVIASYEGRAIAQDLANRLQPPSAGHWFGTDEQGRDLFARVVHGTRISLGIGLSCAMIAALIGMLFGSIAGYFGGIIDNIIMRLLDCLISIPPILMALAIVAALGKSIPNLMIALTVAYIPIFTRLVRACVMSVAGNDYVEAARASGLGVAQIITKYVLPNASGPIIVETTMDIAGIIKAVASLSFIGLGIVPPTPEWGSMLSSSREFMRYAPYLVLFPGLAIVTASLAFNLLGDGLRDALDPKLKD